jgi:hypothetical protein
MRNVVPLSPCAGVRAQQQTAFATLDASGVEAIRSADLDSLTLIEAMVFLAALQEQLS